MFLERFERNILHDKKSGPVRLIFIIFKSDDDNSVNDAVEALENYRNRNPTAHIEYKLAHGEFSRAVGLHMGISMVRLRLFWGLMFLVIRL